MGEIKYRLIYAFLSTGLLASACSSQTQHAQPPPREYEPLSTFSVELRSDEYSSSSYASSSDSEITWGKAIGTLLGIGLSILAINAASDFVDENYDTSDMTEPEKKMGHYMTKSEYKEYYNEHPETWTPVYVVPSE